MSLTEMNCEVDGVAPFRVGASTGTGELLLGRILPEFRRKVSEVSVVQRAGISGEVVTDLLTGEIHAAICGWTPEIDHSEAIGNVMLFRDSCVLVVPRGHFLWERDQITDSELLSLFRSGQPFIGRPSSSGTYYWMLNYLRPRLGDEQTMALLGNLIAQDFGSAIRMVFEGKGVSMMPRKTVGSFVSRGQAWGVGLPGHASRDFYGIWSTTTEGPIAEVVRKFVILAHEELKAL